MGSDVNWFQSKLGESLVKWKPMRKDILPPEILSVESQKGANTIQRCSVESQKGTINIQRSSVENQKGTITIQRCSVENQKGTITTDIV